MVATASLELGIDIGDVDLVCQLGSPYAIATLLQRVGRSGHGVDALPKGRLFPLSRDDLVQCTALLRAVRAGELDTLEICGPAIDVLAQHVVAETAAREWRADELYACCRRAWPYRALERTDFDTVIAMLAEGYSTRRGRQGRFLHLDAVNGRLRGRRGARLVAMTNGGAIPDQFDYEVRLMPADLPVGTLNEDFAFDSSPGDIFQLGNVSYRVLQVTTGTVYVEDAHGAPPGIPFWFGEAPGRTVELSAAVSELRQHAADCLDRGDDVLRRWLEAEAGVPAAAALQLVDYLGASHAALGGLPTNRRIVFERFFDELGDMHLVIHSSFGSRLNRAWGLALRKRFCRKFNFELQAAALEDSIVLSLGPTHSFPAGRGGQLPEPGHRARGADAGLAHGPGVSEPLALGGHHGPGGQAKPQREKGAAAVPAQRCRRPAGGHFSRPARLRGEPGRCPRGPRPSPRRPGDHDCLHELMDVRGLERCCRHCAMAR